MFELARREKKDDDVPAPVEDEDEDGDPVFDQMPVNVRCPHCGLSIVTFIEHESSWVTYLVCITLLLVLNWAAICIVPVVYPLFKDVVHHCPRCLSVLATRSRVALPSFRQEVMSFRFGSCAIVLARKYVVMLLAIVAVIGTVHWARTARSPLEGLDAIQRTDVIGLTWQDFLQDCGFKSYLGNPIHVSVAFDHKFKNKTLHWHGSVHHVEDGFNLFFAKQRGELFVRMDPPQFPERRGSTMPDLVLLYEPTGPLSKQIEKMRKGSQFDFLATMAEVGKRGAPHSMVLWELDHIVEAKKGQKDALEAAATPLEQSGVASEGSPDTSEGGANHTG